MEKIAVLGILIENRAENAPEMQEIITKYGNIIFGRMGTPSLNKHNGIISLHLEADDEKIQQFAGELKKLSGITVNYCYLN